MAAKIMLVEDDTNLSDIYRARLEAEGFQIVIANDGETALAMAVKEHPDLIISDVMMPKISGFDMLDILRGTDGIKDTKVIMMTALGQSEDKIRAEKLGADRYLVKSQVTLEDVVKSVHDVLGDTVAPAPVTEPAATSPEPTTSPSPGAPQEPAPTAQVPVTQPPAEDTNPAPVTATAPTAPELTTTQVPVAQPPADSPAPTVSAPPAAQPTAATTNQPAGTSSQPAAVDVDSDAAPASDEQAAVLSQIQDFVDKQENSSANPAAAPSVETTVAAPTTTPEPATAAPTSPATGSVSQTSSGSASGVNGKKVIQPISNPSPKPDLAALLAKENSSQPTTSTDGIFVAPSPNAPAQVNNIVVSPSSAASSDTDPNKIAL